jgi:hypothetical protein
MMGIIKIHDSRHLTTFYHAQKSVSLKNFNSKKNHLPPNDKELLNLWESMLTGKSVVLSQELKEQYQTLGLNHLFTPSGFHLSAVMLPLMKFISSQRWQLIMLLIIGLGIFSMNGMDALKRMMKIKVSQKFLGQKNGFIFALVLDSLSGSLLNSPLGFCYSTLFLGIIYSESRFLFLWFFVGQSLIAYFSGNLITPFLILFSPILNAAFAFCMPLLFILAIPLWNWQMTIGLKILSLLQGIVLVAGKVAHYFPLWEIQTWSLFCFALFYSRKKKMLIFSLAIFSGSLNIDKSTPIKVGANDFVPQGHILKILESDYGQKVFWTDGKCDRELKQGIWWEKCSPRRRSTKKTKKSSYPSLMH